MARIAILTPAITSADAVSNDVLGMRAVLQKRGHEVQLFAEDWSLSERQVQHHLAINSFLQSPSDVLIYHHSIGWDAGVDLLQEASCRTIIKYHNVTPAEFFNGISPHYQDLCMRGRAQLQMIARAGHDLYLAASAYNLDELRAAGTSGSYAFVVPPFNNADRLHSTEPDLDIVDQYTDGTTNLLMVGGVRPNKGHVALIEAFATYFYQFDCNSRLFIVGPEGPAFEAYSKSIREMAELLCVDLSIIFTGEVSESALKAYYLVSNAFLMTSEHEGFGVPLVEAMAMKLPIVAYECAAIAETVGNAGLVWPERDPLLMAESVDHLVRNETAAVALGLAGRQRYEKQFSNQSIEAQFLGALQQSSFDL
jgi:glycosyltransferase involved in cell wall biosynthesis